MGLVVAVPVAVDRLCLFHVVSGRFLAGAAALWATMLRAQVKVWDLGEITVIGAINLDRLFGVNDPYPVVPKLAAEFRGCSLYKFCD